MARGSFLVSRATARVMIEQGRGGDIVYVVSKNAVFAGPNNVAYGAAKADQAHQVRLLAAELGAHGIRVNGVNPDAVVRGSGHLRRRVGRRARRGRTASPREDLGRFYAERTLLKQEVLPEHVAAAVFVLVSGELPRDHGHDHPRRWRQSRARSCDDRPERSDDAVIAPDRIEALNERSHPTHGRDLDHARELSGAQRRSMRRRVIGEVGAVLRGCTVVGAGDRRHALRTLPDRWRAPHDGGEDRRRRGDQRTDRRQSLDLRSTCPGTTPPIRTRCASTRTSAASRSTR